MLCGFGATLDMSISKRNSSQTFEGHIELARGLCQVGGLCILSDYSIAPDKLNQGHLKYLKELEYYLSPDLPVSISVYCVTCTAQPRINSSSLFTSSMLLPVEEKDEDITD
jgi:hypothetical protein